MKLITVNADDLGYSADVNRAIVGGMLARTVDTASLMANMPGFEEACDLAIRESLQDRVGVHLNITEGEPLTKAIRACSRFCDASGQFRPRRQVWHLSDLECRSVEEEFQAQIDRCVAGRMSPGHLDSHNHVHWHWPIGSIVIRLAHRNHIPKIRLFVNAGPSLRASRMPYAWLYNSRLKRHKLAATDWFLQDVESAKGRNGKIEIMVHPHFDASGALVDLHGEDLENKLQFIGAMRREHAC